MDNNVKYAHIRVLRTTQKNIRIASALADKSGLDFLEELVKRELERLQKERKPDAEKL